MLLRARRGGIQDGGLLSWPGLELQDLQEGKVLGDGPEAAVEGAKHLVGGVRGEGECEDGTKGMEIASMQFRVPIPGGGRGRTRFTLHDTGLASLSPWAYLLSRSSVLAHAVLAEGVPAGQDHGDVQGAAVGLETNGAI